MATDLIFSAPLDLTRPTDLVFGAGGTVPSTDAVGTLSVTLPRPGLMASAVYDNAVQRGPRGGVSSSWQTGTAAAKVDQAGWRQAASRQQADQLPWGAASPVAPSVTVPIGSQTQRAHAEQLPWGAATPAHADSTARWQERTPIVRSSALHHQDGTIARRETLAPYQDRQRNRRPQYAALWADAARAARELIARHQRGTSRLVGDQLPWGEARKPPPGRSPTDPITPPIRRCYTPPQGHSVTLRYAERWLPSTQLLFRCREFDLPPQYFVPFQRVYMTVHHITAVRLPDLMPLVINSATIATDADSFCWTLQASGKVDLLQQLAPVGGQMAQIQITIDGTPWVFVVEKLRRTRAFGQQRCQIEGRSVTALLAAPYLPETSWLNTAQKTAAQIVDDALFGSGVAATFGLDDWIVPTGAWSHRGTPLGAVLRVAESVKGVVQSHKTLPELLIKPRYPLMPWEWYGAAVAPDVQMPLASIVTDGLERRDQPEYNRVIVTGQTQGVMGIITRLGTAGDLALPTVTEALATDQPAVLQRGRSELGAVGKSGQISLTLPLLTGGTNPGVLDVNQLVEIVEPAETWRGMVRAVSVQAGFPTVRQSVTVERHYA